MAEREVRSVVYNMPGAPPSLRDEGAAEWSFTAAREAHSSSSRAAAGIQLLKGLEPSIQLL